MSETVEQPKCNCPGDYARWSGDNHHNDWCPRSPNYVGKPEHRSAPAVPEEKPLWNGIDLDCPEYLATSRYRTKPAVGEGKLKRDDRQDEDESRETREACSAPENPAEVRCQECNGDGWWRDRYDWVRCVTCGASGIKPKPAPTPEKPADEDEIRTLNTDSDQ